MVSSSEYPDAAAVIAAYGLEPLPVEGGYYRQTWTGSGPDGTRPAGTAILYLLTDAPDQFSAMHRLPSDELWHHYRGDELELLLLHPDGSGGLYTLGGTTVQLVVPADTWMGARLAAGGKWALCGTTMAPGFLPEDYEGADGEQLSALYPDHAVRIRALTRPGQSVRMREQLTL
jgi:predicted cupin superfamily sugar epimerase